MNSFRNVQNDILKDWLSFREETIASLNCSDDKKIFICFEEICNNILNIVSVENKDYISSQLNILNESFMDYISYWNKKYYKNGFCDGINLISGCFNV